MLGQTVYLVLPGESQTFVRIAAEIPLGAGQEGRSQGHVRSHSVVARAERRPGDVCGALLWLVYQHLVSPEAWGVLRPCE